MIGTSEIKGHSPVEGSNIDTASQSRRLTDLRVDETEKID
jgi:hypothetical protein